MATKRDIDNAWNIHDHTDNPDCDKKPGWNEKLSHSRYNPGCKVWVEDYANKNPLPPPTPAPLPRKSIYPRQTCAGCGRVNREDRMKKLIMEDRDENDKVLQTIEVMVCSNKCGKRAARKIAREHPTMAPPTPSKPTEQTQGIIPTEEQDVTK
jgi:hypothetical protein